MNDSCVDNDTCLGYVPQVGSSAADERCVPRRYDPAHPFPLEHQPAPGTVWALVIADMCGRDQLGLRKYGRPLLPNDGRDSLQDLYEELLDAAVYIKKAMLERDSAQNVK